MTDAAEVRAETTVRVTFWGPLTDAVAVPERDVAVERGATPRDVARRLSEADTGLGEALGAKGIVVMADDAIIDWETDISRAREVAFMSPMSGG
ncbi:MAG: MoaD/ThiS family protein [Pseudomonadota bacterium]|jgi:molybdopterin converting factor small subunit